MAEDLPLIDVWKGVPVAKMARKVLEHEFIRLASEAANQARRISPKPPLDPHTARALRELREICDAIDNGSAGVLAFADGIESHPTITRSISARIGYITRKP